MTISSGEHAFFVELGIRIAELRKAQGITQIQMAKALGVSQQTINAYEVGRRRIPTSALPPLARLFAMSITELLLGENDKAVEEKCNTKSEFKRQIDYVSKLPHDKQKNITEILEVLLQNEANSLNQINTFK